MLGIDQRPGLAAVVGAVQAAFFGFDHGVDAFAVGRGHRDADLPIEAFGQALASCSDCGFARSPSGPSLFQVSPPSRETYRPLPGPPLVISQACGGLPQAGEEDARIVRIEADVDGAGVVDL